MSTVYEDTDIFQWSLRRVVRRVRRPLLTESRPWPSKSGRMGWTEAYLWWRASYGLPGAGAGSRPPGSTELPQVLGWRGPVAMLFGPLSSPPHSLSSRAGVWQRQHLRRVGVVTRPRSPGWGWMNADPGRDGTPPAQTQVGGRGEPAHL